MPAEPQGAQKHEQQGEANGLPLLSLGLVLNREGFPIVHKLFPGNACYATVVLPCKDGKEYHIRKPGLPDERQKMLYRALGINLQTLTVLKTVLKPEKSR